MNKRSVYITIVILAISGIGLFSLNADYLTFASSFPEPELLPQDPDTLPSRFPVAKTMPDGYEGYKDVKDILTKPPVDLRDPENVKTTIEYDIRTGMYIVRTRIGDMEMGTPISLTPEEYQDYSLRESLRSYFREKNEEEFRKEADKQFNITDMQFDLGPAERFFGPGGVRVRTQGSAEITMGLKQNKTDNPSLPQRARNRTFFNFDENVQLNVQASVGSKINFNMNYNTETTFDFDSKQLKLAYSGEEDEIIKTLEAGNVSMTTNNSLINGGAALFGIKADLQFGKLRVNTLFAQQNSESKTVNSKGGVQTTPFEITADSYDENRHFFLAHYFRDMYDYALEKLPYIRSSVKINKVEVWITNKRGNFDNTRNIVALTDLGEYRHIGNPAYTPQGSLAIPYNRANTLYERISSMDEIRDKGNVSRLLEGVLDGGSEYEEIESARLLSPNEYTVNTQLGYISLSTQLQPDEVLAVAFDYEYNGVAYQVGEFSTDNITGTSGRQQKTTDCLLVKLLKGTTLSPTMMYWNLMMKNVYSLNAYSVQKENFKLDILYQSDTTGIYMNYLTEGSDDVKNKLLLRVMNLDRLDSRNESNPDGIFDFVEGFTVLPENGRVVFPVVEPFGSHLRKKINDPIIAEKYVYQELYDTTLTAARQIAEKNKFILRGEYKASSGSQIDLGASNVAQGSVRVTANGALLTENVDYIVDYTSGSVTVLNESIIASNTPISVSLENQSTYSMQRKTMMGVDVNYDFSKDFSLGATIMHMSEMPLTTKTAFGDESIKNTLWGLNTSYRGESQWLTNMLDKLPLLTLTKPSQITFNAEFAHLIAGHYENKNTGGYSYLDDFESTQTSFDLLNPYPWNLASTPYEDSNPKFLEASKINNIEYGKNRALLAWYYIDGMFTRTNSSLMPSHLKGDREQLSNHYVRAVSVKELYPGRELASTEANLLSVLNVAYYPKERGPYNIVPSELDENGLLRDPEKRWGGMMRKIDQTDFEAANIEYIEFWMMDPFIYNKSNEGELYFDLGELSEDILKDEKKFFENGLPVDGDESKVETTVWGKVPKAQSTVYAFDNTSGARELQDVGLNGLNSQEEETFGAYKDFLDDLEQRLDPETFLKFKNDPAGDNFTHYRGAEHDRNETSILDRYKYYNGTEGNSAESSGQTYTTASRTTPDVEDLNQDNNMNKNEKYFQYKIRLKPNMQVGEEHIVNIDTATVSLANGTTDNVVWYQFKVPLKEYEKTVGSISDFKTVRFMRMYLTGFKDTTILRFGKFELVRGEWRTYTQNLYGSQSLPAENATLDVSSVNIEENSRKTPVNYVVPWGVSRSIDPGQPQIIQQNEQALSMKVTNLASDDARAVYKTTSYDLRQYKRLQLYTHAEALDDGDASRKPRDGDLSVFIRLGSDYKNNYYEYQVPLELTPPGNYSTYSTSQQRQVWPESNLLNFRLEVLTNLKLSRNRLKSQGDINFQQLYSEYDPDNNMNKVSIVGNPSLSDVKVIMIGVRNNSAGTKSAEVWVNELRLTDFNEDGGWAANANLNIALSDLGTVNFGGRIETAGFGGLDQSLNERRMDDYKQYNVTTNVELGKFFPAKAKVSLPISYMYSKEIIDPKYNPMDQDITLKDAVDAVATKLEKDSILNYAREKTTIKSISVNNLKVDIRSKNPMPYDPANFSMGYSFNETQINKPDTEYETTKNYNANFAYNYSPYAKPLRPFAKVKKNAASTRYIKQLSLNYLPSNISFQTVMMRNYYEMQLRDVSGVPGGIKPEVSFSDNFFWDRAFSISWNIVSNLRTSFSSGTNARIEHPNVQVNKKINPDDYQLWKDSIKQSIRDLGTPMEYDQNFNVSYNLPLQFIPILDWVTATTTYNATYNWDRGARLDDDDAEIGNTIRNQRQMDMQGGLNFLSLYNKNKFLREVNQKFTTSTRGATQTREREKPKGRPKMEVDVQLSPDSGVIVKHGQFTKKMTVRARGANGKIYPVKFKAIDYANIRIENLDTAKLKLTIFPAPPRTETFTYKAMEYSSRFLMMIRRVNVQYSLTDGMMVPGFRPEIGDVFGQGRTGGVFAPGLKFAFGAVNKGYIDELIGKDWLVMDQTNANPAIINSSKTLTANMNLEPIPGLKIDLNALRTDVSNTEIKYMNDGRPETRGGNFSMTTIALGSAFEGMGSAENGYASKTFDEFLANRTIIASRLEDAYTKTFYPNTETPYERGGVRENSTDVLIPAFLAAYTGKNANSISLTAFPSIAALLPNWRVSYDGLIRIPIIKKYFKDLQLNHRYTCTYSVGSFSSFLNWVDAGRDGLGYIRDLSSNNFLPSSAYDISAVSLNEAFNPLIGIDGTMLNNVTLRSEFRKNRNMNLNISSYQLVESHTNEMIIGLGYKFADFNKVLKRKPTQNFNNDLTLRLDFSYSKRQSLIRKIEDASAQATSGNIAKTIQFSADYALSRALTVRAFYDLQINEPLISSTSYPTSNSSYGVSLRFSLAQ